MLQRLPWLGWALRQLLPELLVQCLQSWAAVWGQINL